MPPTSPTCPWGCPACPCSSLGRPWPRCSTRPSRSRQGRAGGQGQEGWGWGFVVRLQVVVPAASCLCLQLPPHLIPLALTLVFVMCWDVSEHGWLTHGQLACWHSQQTVSPGPLKPCFRCRSTLRRTATVAASLTYTRGPPSRFCACHGVLVCVCAGEKALPLAAGLLPTGAGPAAGHPAGPV